MAEGRDRLTPQQRSLNMSRIRGKNTRPEMTVRKLLHALGYRYRLHGAGLPDLVFAGRRKVIFVNGCFWHYHDSRAGTYAPTANAEFWEAKRARTKARDRHQLERLESDGWDVLTVWECQLRDRSALEDQLTRFLDGGGRKGSS